ncbi:hypothetical protein OIDMADRAFT_21012 [Oidiodendron maius Zn]|uniref:Uncharacterized protein n=1 Tax=Oidiodendron maius (strain Zn) TaxID=913774 RepID=A0A0C3GHH0_OIDMZ|nr:hypothetical protein OIDMADRAFT_21012 [Oidiodendron maius Zn]
MNSFPPWLIGEPSKATRSIPAPAVLQSLTAVSAWLRTVFDLKEDSAITVVKQLAPNRSDALMKNSVPAAMTAWV